MQLIFQIITALASGIFTGIIYGLSCVVQRQRALSPAATNFTLFLIGSSMLRLGLLAVPAYFLLLMGTIPFILFGAAFILSFWLFLITQKV